MRTSGLRKTPYKWRALLATAFESVTAKAMMFFYIRLRRRTWSRRRILFCYCHCSFSQGVRRQYYDLVVCKLFHLIGDYVSRFHLESDCPVSLQEYDSIHSQMKGIGAFFLFTCTIKAFPLAVKQISREYNCGSRVGAPHLSSQDSALPSSPESWGDYHTYQKVENNYCW